MKLYKYLLLIPPLFAIQSCSREVGEDPNASAALKPRIAGVSLITRGGAGDANAIRILGIYAVNKNAGETFYGTSPAGTSRKYTLNNGSATPDGEALWLNQEQAIIFSWHPVPAGVSVTSGGNGTAPVPTITIPASAIIPAQTISAAKADNLYDFALPSNDYMYGVKYDNSQPTETDKYLSIQPVADNGHQSATTPAVPPVGHEVSIGLKHAFAQVSFIIKKSDAYKSMAKVTKVTHTRQMPALKADNTTTMNLTDGALKSLADVAEVTYSYTFDDAVAPTLSTIPQITLTNYVIPYGTTAKQSTLVVTVDGKEMTLLPYTDPVWTAGNIYTYTIIINPTGLTLDGFNITGWNDEQRPDVNV